MPASLSTVQSIPAGEDAIRPLPTCTAWRRKLVARRSEKTGWQECSVPAETFTSDGFGQVMVAAQPSNLESAAEARSLPLVPAGKAAAQAPVAPSAPMVQLMPAG